MEVKMLEDAPVTIDGVHTVEAAAGDTLDVSDGVAATLIASGRAETKDAGAADENKSVASMSSKQLDEHAAELGVDGWDKKATVAAKKAVLEAVAAAKEKAAAIRADLPADRDELNTLAGELAIDEPEAFESDEQLVDAIVAKKLEAE